MGTLRKAFAGPAGQLTRQWLESAVDSIGGVNGELRWGYDLRGRLLADTAYSGAVPRPQTYTYDLWERANTRTDAIGTWTTRFETARGVPDTLQTPLGDSLTLGLDPLLRPTSMKNVGPTGTAIEFLTRAWNASGELASMEHAINVFSSPTWTALSMERITAIDSGGPPLGPLWVRQDGAVATPDTLRDTVAYDGWQRVTSYVLRSTAAGHAPVLALSYSFDAVGNRQTPGGGEVYNAVTNQLRVVGTNTLSYDAAGNLIARSSGAWAYGYDALERLVSVRKGGVLIARYGYDVAGRRIVKRVYSGTSGGTVGYLRMVYAGNQVAFETDSHNTAPSTIYTWGPGVDNLVGLTVNDTAYTAVTDPLGSVRALVRRTGGVWVGRLLYDPYGQLVDSAGPQPPLRYRWTGREWDAETGWYFHRSRYYDPEVGRFVQEDKVGYGGGNNLYAYVNGDVLQARDPDGLVKDATWAYLGWDAMCLGVDLCFGGGGELRPLTGGASYGQRQANQLIAWGNAAWTRWALAAGTQFTLTYSDGEVQIVSIHIDPDLIDDMSTCIMESPTCRDQVNQIAALVTYEVWYEKKSSIVEKGERQVGWTNAPWWERTTGVPLVFVYLDPSHLSAWNARHGTDATMTDVIIHENAHAMSFENGVMRCTDARTAAAPVGCAQGVTDRARQQEGSGRYIP